MSKSLTRIAIVTALVLLMLIPMLPAEASNEARVLLGAKERVKLMAPGGEVEVVAKIDTGADYSSLDRSLALSLAYKAGDRKTRITGGNGSKMRETAKVKFMLAGREITTRVTLADRSGLSTPMLIGRNDMAGFTVDPGRQFLTRPDAVPSPLTGGGQGEGVARSAVPSPLTREAQGEGVARSALPSPLTGEGQGQGVARSALPSPLTGEGQGEGETLVPARAPPTGAWLLASMVPIPLALAPDLLPAGVLPAIDLLDEVTTRKILLIIPILGVAVVIGRLLIGMRTYGVFGPVVIALTLLQLGVPQGTIFYLLLVVIGIGIQTFFLSRIRLPHVAQFALILFTLVLIVTAVNALSAGSVPLSSAVFPLIITSHLIEQASQSVAEERFADVVGVLATTLALAIVLGLIGTLLLALPTVSLWAIFGIAIVAVIASGRYLGLRLTELVRFRFLRKTHVHK
ncbi:MAG: hypothetical protein HYY29_01700 [Chloroflexi bacterium]|nr:hypothetical protein [Chloroflexota bacterium]